MASSYRKIQDYDDVLWEYGSPVIVEKMKLQFDKNYGVNVLQITFRNVSKLAMYGLSIQVILKGDDGRDVHTPVDFNYYAMEIQSGKTFGNNEDIVVEPEAVSFEIIVKGADLANGMTYYDKVKLGKIPGGQLVETLDEFEEPYIERVQELYPKAKIHYVGESKREYWRCTCGRIWPHEIKACTYCKTDKEGLLSVLSDLKEEDRQRREEEARLAAEEAERRREEERIAEEERIKREEEEEKARIEAEEQRKIEEEKRAIEEAAKKKKRNQIIAILAGVAVVGVVTAVLIPSMEKRHQSRDFETKDTVVEMKDSDNVVKDEDQFLQIMEKPEEKEEVKVPEPMVAPIEKKEEEQQKALLIIDADRTDIENDTLWRLFGYEEGTVPNLETIEIPASWGQSYMNTLAGVEGAAFGGKASVLIVPKESGGINISMFNIDGYTEEDFKKEIRKLGYENADVVIASPETSNGSSAMFGLQAQYAREQSANGNAIGMARAKVNINVRTGPGTQYDIITTLPVGSEVQVLEITENQWLKIVWPGSALGFAYTSNSNGGYYEFF